MEKESKTNIDSFIIRFVQEKTDSDANQCAYRGEIRHIQSDEEVTFKCWAEAETFIQNFIPIN
jgi:predicted small secreted protein